MEIKNKNSISEYSNNYDFIFPDTATIHSLFEEQADEFPENIALIFQGQKITYRDFNEKSNQLARFLRNYRRYNRRYNNGTIT
jgi:non-ribosomal peptide synthetase component F